MKKQNLIVCFREEITRDREDIVMVYYDKDSKCLCYFSLNYGHGWGNSWEYFKSLKRSKNDRAEQKIIAYYKETSEYLDDCELTIIVRDTLRKPRHF